MRTIGLIGGMSWESTITYYKVINERIRERKGGLASAKIALYSVNFAEIVDMQKAGRWDLATEALAQAAKGLVKAGADCILICTNTMHLIADPVQKAAGVPLLHIVDATGAALKAKGATKPLLLATRYTMEHPFYAERLRANFGLDPLIPDAADRDTLHAVIFDELCQGIVKDSSRAAFQAIIARNAAKGADAVILGCTEIGLLLNQSQIPLPAFDSTLLHASAAVDFALSEAPAFA
jgi:aspartate racemase